MDAALDDLWRRSMGMALSAFFLTFVVILLLKPLARRLGLVDRPGGRKRHAFPTPVIGGLAVLAGSVPLAITTFEFTPQVWALALAGAIVMVSGFLDDIFDLHWLSRIAAQTLAALALIYVGDVRVENIGPIFGAQAGALGILSTPVTIIATVGLMNALNMADGVDGLAGSLTAAALAMLAAAAVYAGNDRLSHGAIVLLGALLAFLAFNVRTPWLPKAQIFLGNAGSEFLGLVIAWALFRLTQNPHHPVTPALALFLIAPPVIDCLVLMVRRIRDGASPFAADRNHLHHLLLDAGWTTTAVVGFITAASVVIGLAAALSIKAHVPPVYLTVAFVILTVAYYSVSAKRSRCIGFFTRLANAASLLRWGAGRSAQRNQRS